MFFIGIITDKNSENNIKDSMKNKLNSDNLVFLNENNIENFRNVKFDSVVINEEVKNEYVLNKILENSKYILCNSDIHFKSNSKDICSNIITYGYNSKANVTISSATDDSYLLYIQNSINANNKIDGMQEIKFDKFRSNINAYDSMIITLMDLLYKEK